MSGELIPLLIRSFLGSSTSYSSKSVRDVHAKELDVLELKKDNKKLTIVRGPGLDAGKDLHERELQLIGEVESNSTTVQKLGMSLPVAAEESLTSAYVELNDLHSKLRHAEKLCAQLQINEEAIQKLKEKLSKAEANVQEMEEKLIALLQSGLCNGWQVRSQRWNFASSRRRGRQHCYKRISSQTL